MLTDQKESCYRAFKSKDARFDGKIFVGVSSTGIYCRPICTAKVPKIENCTFFATSAEAERAGYRPCLLCRPELAPGFSAADASSVLAQRAARFLEENCGTGQSLEEAAGKLGYTERHLRRVFQEAYHVTPVEYLQTCRLLLAKNLLTDTDLSILEVAMASGFGSLRRMNDLFQKRYHLSPTALRKKTASEKKHIGEVSVALGYRPPYQWDIFLDFLKKRAIPGVECVREDQYMRTVRLAGKENQVFGGWICVGCRKEKNVLSVTLSDTLIPVLTQVLARIRQMFDLYCEPGAVCETLRDMDEIWPGLCIPGIRVPGCFDAFEMSVRAVLGQQITVKAAKTLAGRIAKTYGKPIQTGTEGLEYLFPNPEEVSAMGETIEEKFGVLGVTGAKSRGILALARAFQNGELDLNPCADAESQMKKLMEFKGIGAWTAKYIVMRTMGWPDAFLETDAGIKKALSPRSETEMLELSKRWQPWRSYAMMNLWNMR